MRYKRKIILHLEYEIEGPDCTEEMKFFNRQIGKHGLAADQVGPSGGGTDYRWDSPKYKEMAKRVKAINGVLEGFEEGMINVLNGEPYNGHFKFTKSKHNISNFYPQKEQPK